MTLSLVSLVVTALAAAAGPQEAAEPPLDAGALARFHELRFGMFVHWGPVSLAGTEIGWSRGREVPVEEYDRLPERFAPARFDAREWARVARAAGMRYLVLTTKHHDGFCLWPSALTGHDVERLPTPRDFVGQLAAACREEGVRFGAYYSICDWYHPDYPLGSPGGRSPKPEPDMARYVEYVRGQTCELLEHYGPLLVLWFDGEWEAPWTREHGVALYRELKALQPDLLINNRVDKSRRGMAGTSEAEATIFGDFDTPEQRVGAFQRERAWETCMTLCTQWAWKPDDRLKPLDECLRILVQTVGGDGNLLLNVGPMPDGRIEPRQAARLREIGEWLRVHGEAVYGTRGGPYRPGRWGASTSKDERVWIHVLRWPLGGALRLSAPGPRIVSTRTLGGAAARVEVGAEGVLITPAPEDLARPVTVVELRLEERATELAPLEVQPLGPPLPVASVRASNVFGGQAEFAPERAVDRDRSTRWATDAGTRTAWIELDLGQEREVAAAAIDEAYPGRVQAFALEAWRGESWEQVHAGASLGEDFELKLAPFRARRVRLSVTEASEGPTLREVALFGQRP